MCFVHYTVIFFIILCGKTYLGSVSFSQDLLIFPWIVFFWYIVNFFFIFCISVTLMTSRWHYADGSLLPVVKNMSKMILFFVTIWFYTLMYKLLNLFIARPSHLSIKIYLLIVRSTIVIFKFLHLSFQATPRFRAGSHDAAVCKYTYVRTNQCYF